MLEKNKIDELICDFSECGRVAKYKTPVPLCSGHYSQKSKGKKLTPIVQRIKAKGEVCIFEGCTEPVRAKLLCTGHWKQNNSGYELTPLKPRQNSGKCIEDGCNDENRIRGRCLYHDRRHRTLKVNPDAQRRRSKEEILHRDELGNKKCTRCGKFHPEAHFRKTPNSPDGLKNYCNTCESISQRNKKFNVDILSILEDQSWSCGACGCDIGIHSSVVDHFHGCCNGDYSCGICVRALLCQRCNITLGMSGEDSNRLRKLANYSDKYKDRPVEKQWFGISEIIPDIQIQSFIQVGASCKN